MNMNINLRVKEPEWFLLLYFGFDPKSDYSQIFGKQKFSKKKKKNRKQRNFFILFCLPSNSRPLVSRS